MYGPAQRCSIVAHDALLLVAPAAGIAPAKEEIMPDSNPNTGGHPIKVGVVADQTGPLSVAGLANANVARMVIGDINAKGGLLGRRLDLYLEDSATDDAVAAAKARKLVEDDEVDVIFGGIYSSTRQAIKGPAVVEGKTLYIYPEQYEGQESDPLIFCTGPVPAQQVDPFIPWLMRETGAKTFYLPSADYIWPHVMNARVREVVTASGGAIVGEEYFPVDHADYRATVERITASGADVVFNTTVPPGVAPFFEQLYDSGFTSRGGHLVCTYFEENLLSMFPAAHAEGLYSCLDYYQAVSDPFSQKLLAQYDALYPGDAKFTGGIGCSGLYRGLRLWAAAVAEAGSLTQEEVIAALDHAQIADGPGGPAAMVPGQHHARMNMYIAQARNGRFEIVENLGAIDPQERLVGTPVLAV
jgi:ABC-type branched-subunit amino acid transport system substrate-binding protein